MTLTQAERLRSEIAEVKRLLEGVSEDAIIVRMSFKDRLEVLQKRLAEVEEKPQAHPLSIVFRGAPVEGSRSIDASFAAKAVQAFVDANNTVTSSLLNNDLAARGRLPGAKERSLRIVSTAVGSFGFALELPPAAPKESTLQLPYMPERPDVHVDAIYKTLQILDKASQDDEAAIVELVAEVHPRAAVSIGKFVKVISENDAFFALDFGTQQLRFDRKEQLERVLKSLAESDVSESEEMFSGTLLGLLPEAREFEARLSDNSVVRGKVENSVSDIEALKAWVGKEAQLFFSVVRVRENKRYILRNIRTSAEHSDGE